LNNAIRHAGTLLLATFTCVSAVRAEPVVNPLLDATPASAAVLLQSIIGNSLTVVPGSVQYSGAASASGTFTNGGTGPDGLGIDRGAVLTTGDAQFIAGSASFPGDDTNKSNNFTAGIGNALTSNTAPGDPLLDGLTTDGTTNASSLSFSFIPYGRYLTLGLVFGSEDYNDLINTGFPTDVFGIFVNGINHALVPGTSTPISASSVNCGGPTSGPAPGAGPNCGLYRDNPPFSGLIATELDGLTVALDLLIPVNLGVVNTITIAIADAFDDVGDSALLIREGSVSAVPEPSTPLLALAALAFLVLARRRPGTARPV
jgi:hypothetical protein